MGYVDHGFRHSPGGSDPIPGGIYPIKVISDTQTLATGDGQFSFLVTAAEHLGGRTLVEVGAYVTTVSSSGTPTIQIRKVGVGDLLSTRITIDVGDKSSDDAATPPVIGGTYALVSTGDVFAIDVDVAGTGARGLGVILRFA